MSSLWARAGVFGQILLFLVAVHIGVVGTRLSGIGAIRGWLRWHEYRAELRPVVNSKEIAVADRSIENKEDVHLFKIIKFCTDYWVTFGSVFSGGSQSLYEHVHRGIIRNNQASGESSVGIRVVQFRRFPVLNFLYKEVAPYNPSGGCFSAVCNVNSRPDPSSIGRKSARSSGNFYPRSLVLSHCVQLPAHDYELIDRGQSEYGGKESDNAISEASLFSPSPKLHRSVLLFFGFVLSCCGVFCLIFGGSYFAFESPSFWRFLVCVLLGAFSFALVFALAHASYL